MTTPHGASRLIILAALKCAIVADTELSDAFARCWMDERARAMAHDETMVEAYSAKFPTVADLERVYRELANV